MNQVLLTNKKLHLEFEFRKLNKVETLEEVKVEILCAKESIEQVISAMKHSHPYEQVAYSVFKMENS